MSKKKSYLLTLLGYTRFINVAAFEEATMPNKEKK